jgi:hypothetical protein
VILPQLSTYMKRHKDRRKSTGESSGHLEGYTLHLLSFDFFKMKMNFCCSVFMSWSLSSSYVNIATAYGLDDRGVGVWIRVGSRIFSSSRHPDRLWAHPASYLTGSGNFSPGVKRPRREADHSLCRHSTIHLQGVVLIYLSAGITLPFMHDTYLVWSTKLIWMFNRSPKLNKPWQNTVHFNEILCLRVWHMMHSCS